MTTGVLIMAYGTPDSPSDIAPYYTRIRHGRAPSDEQLADLVRRYEAIGGISPLKARTQAQVDGIAAELERRHPGEFMVAFGAKYKEPFVEDGARLLAASCDRVIGLVLTPHQASMGSEEYMTRARAVLDEAVPPVPFIAITAWYDQPGFAELQAQRLLTALDAVSETDPDRIEILFTAHSLPQRVVAAGDTYPDQLFDSAKLIGDACGIETFNIAWQSAGRTPEPWIGPDILAVIAELANQGKTTCVVCPVGFVADHLEVLFDLDIEATAAAEAASIAFSRTASLNDDPVFCAILADAIEDAAGTR